MPTKSAQHRWWTEVDDDAPKSIVMSSGSLDSWHEQFRIKNFELLSRAVLRETAVQLLSANWGAPSSMSIAGRHLDEIVARAMAHLTEQRLLRPYVRIFGITEDEEDSAWETEYVGVFSGQPGRNRRVVRGRVRREPYRWSGLALSQEEIDSLVADDEDA